MARTVPFTEARNGLKQLFDDVERRHEHVVITRNGRPSVVVLSSAEYETLQETLEILGDERTMEALRQSDEDVEAGRLYSVDEVKRDLGLA